MSYPVSIENDDCYKITVSGALDNGEIYFIDAFAIEPENKNRYFYNGDTGEFTAYFTTPSFACKTSPDKKLRMESVGMYLDGPSGLHSLKKMRIINLTTGKEEWSAESYLSNYFEWSSDSRFAAARYSGREWTETIIIDTNDYSVIHLPGIDDIRFAAPDAAKPNLDAPMSRFAIAEWKSPEIIIINFEWAANDEGITVTGKYEFDIIRKTMDIIEIQGGDKIYGSRL